jgi:hypothetical protein
LDTVGAPVVDEAEQAATAGAAYTDGPAAEVDPMRRVVLAFAVLVGCGSAGVEVPAAGVVSRLAYDDPDDWTTTTSCTTNDFGCVGGMKTQQHHDGPHWWVMVATDQDVVRPVEVTEATFDRCRLGARFEAGGCLG